MAKITQNTVNAYCLLCRILGRSPSPMKGMRGTASSLDWDHSVDTVQVPQGKQMFPLILDLRRLMTLFVYFVLFILQMMKVTAWKWDDRHLNCPI